MRALGILLLLPLYALFFVGMWAVILRVIAAFGWSRLAARYAATVQPGPDAQRVRWGTLNIGSRFLGPSYRGAVNAWFDRDGLFLKPALLFGAAHPMLFLPWRDMLAVEEGGTFIPRTTVQLAGGAPAIIFYDRLAAVVADNWRDQTAAKGPR